MVGFFFLLAVVLIVSAIFVTVVFKIEAEVGFFFFVVEAADADRFFVVSLFENRVTDIVSDSVSVKLSEIVSVATAVDAVCVDDVISASFLWHDAIENKKTNVRINAISFFMTHLI